MTGRMAPQLGIDRHEELEVFGIAAAHPGLQMTLGVLAERPPPEARATDVEPSRGKLHYVGNRLAGEPLHLGNTMDHFRMSAPQLCKQFRGTDLSNLHRRLLRSGGTVSALSICFQKLHYGLNLVQCRSSPLNVTRTFLAAAS